MSDKYHRQARKNVPDGYAVLPAGEDLEPSDFVWNWVDHEWLRADSMKWKFSPLVDTTDLICAIRKIGMSAFERSVPAKRTFTLSR